jgi:type I restriction enzyme S subunit
MLENVGKACAFNSYEEVAIGGDIILYKTVADVCFISYLLNTQLHRKKIVFLSQGSTIRHVYASTFVDYEIETPSLGEQQAITEILSEMDDEITALEQKRAKTCLLKQGMMQELLTGRIRLT